MNIKRIPYMLLIMSGILSVSFAQACDVDISTGVKDETVSSVAEDVKTASGADDIAKSEEKVECEKKLPSEEGAEADSESSNGCNVTRLKSPDIEAEDEQPTLFGVDLEDIILPSEQEPKEEKTGSEQKEKRTYLPPRNDGWSKKKCDKGLIEFVVDDFRCRLKQQAEFFNKQGGIVSIDGVTAVVGDVHGDYVTLKDIVDRLTIELDSKRVDNVLFLGDILDRGPGSSITLSMIFSFFDSYRGQIYLIRGNHETMSMYISGECTFPARDEPLMRRIDLETIEEFFDSLPYAAIINGTTLAVHGGVPHCDNWERFWKGEKIPERDNGGFKLVLGVLWSDYKLGGDGKFANVDRGFVQGSGAVFFDEDTVQKFLSSSGIKTLSYLIRGHQLFGIPFSQTRQQVITTVFSAINGQPEELQAKGAAVALVRKSGAPINYMHFE